MPVRRWKNWVRRTAVLSATLLLAAGRVTADDAEGPAPAPAAGPGAPAEEGDVPTDLDARVKTAVERGVAWLRGVARSDGSYGPLSSSDEKSYNGTTGSYTTPYGATSLALYTLMKCGVEDSDPLVRKGLGWLRKSKPDGDAYEIAMELLAVTATADPFKKAAESEGAGTRVKLTGENRAWAEGLLANLLKQRGSFGWRYWGKSDPTKGGNQDLSSTQLAVLALFAAERCGLRVDAKVWSEVIRYALEQQDDDGPSRRRAVHPRPPPGRALAAPAGGTTAGPRAGDDDTPDKARGFAYLRLTGPTAADRQPTAAMTACGIGILTMARFSLMVRSPKVWAKEDAGSVQAGIYDGLAWLDANWTPYAGGGRGDWWSLYYVYCVERAMDLVGSQRLGTRLWYLEMANEVLRRQKPDGSWEGAASKFNASTLDTCFALLFLQRATRGGIPYPSVTGGSDVPSSDGR